MLMLYTVASLRPRRRAAGAAALLSAVWIFSAARDPHAVLATAVAQALVFSGTLWKFGDSARKLTLSNLTLADTAERLRLEQEDRARAAVARERARIAGELHDVVAHHLTVVSVQAGLARYVLATDPETSGRALDTVLSSSSEALEELRRVLFLFRAEPDPPAGPDSPTGPYAPAAGLRELPALVSRVRSAGVDLALRVDGAPYPLSPGADLCAYRVVQESLTNILKHAPGSRASIAVGYGAEQLTVRISNDSSAAAPGPGTGGGLLGMRERARVYGGALHAGADPQGGFAVLLTLPAAGVTARHPGQSPDS
jgi:signal transduction histidine kinase